MSAAGDPPYSGQRHPGHPQFTQADIDAAVQAERERIRQLALGVGALYSAVTGGLESFADLIGGAP